MQQAMPDGVQPGDELDVVLFVHGYNTDAVEALKRQRLAQKELRARGVKCLLVGYFIAVGALLPASAGTFIRMGWGDWLYASELFGAALMFLGFWLATQPQPADRPARVAARA